MKKIKIRRKSNKIFFSTRFFLLIFIAIIVFTSSAYAVLSESLTITGSISGQIVYTYYFEKPDDWSTVNAYLWTEPSKVSYTAWPGKAMDSTGELSSRGKPVYKIEIKPDDPKYRQYDRIIFNDGSKQTVDITLSTQNINQIYYFPTTGTRRLYFYTQNGAQGSRTYVHVWKNGGNSLTTWPGTEVTSTYNSSNKQYYYDVTHDYDYFIVNRGSGQWQTGNIHICDYGSRMRLVDYSTWTDFEGLWENYTTLPTSVLSPSHLHN